MNNNDYRKIQEMQRINTIKEKNNCLVCELVITEEFKEPPISVVHGNGGKIEMAMMIKCLEDLAENLKSNFPETKNIIPILKHTGGLKEAYKEIVSEQISKMF